MTEATPRATPDFDRLPELDRAVESRLRPEIRPRSSWGEQRPPVGPLELEDDVRFLLVHHTASTNDYEADEVIEQIRDFYDLHVGPDRGWPDVAYNFLVDRFGGIWEARHGSIAEAISGDATGGSQGFAQLAGLIGDHVEAPPSVAALDGLTRLLAWLAHRHRVDTTPGSTITFSSRGSSRWAAGVEVTARTISGHRDMSLTACPGDPVYELLGQSIPERIQQLRQTALVEASAELGVDLPAPSGTADRTPATIASEAIGVGTGRMRDDADDDTDRYLVSAGATMVVGGLAGLIALRKRRIG